MNIAQDDQRRLGHLVKRLRELSLDDVSDPRRPSGCWWTLPQLLTATLGGMVSGCQSFAETEEMTAELSTGAAVMLNLPRRVPDTTARTTLIRLQPDELRQMLHRQVLRAHKRKQLAPVGLPFGVVAIDGKCTATSVIDDRYAQRHHLTAKGKTVGVQGLVRTLTFCLTSARAPVCMDAHPIHASTNEVGQLKEAFAEFDATFRRSGLAQMVTLDAGFFCADIAADINDRGYGYVIQLKDERRDLRARAKRKLGHRKEATALAQTVDKMGDGVLVTRRIWMTPLADVPGWPHARGIIRVQSERWANGEITSEDRFYVTNYAAAGLNPAQWLYLIRSHWKVENNCHWTYDVVFAEDDRHWVDDPQGMIVLQLLRRIACNLLALFRAYTLRRSPGRHHSWPQLLRAFMRTFARLGMAGGAPRDGPAPA